MTVSGRIINLLLIVATLLGVHVIAAPSAYASAKKIAFVRDGDIWLMNDDGTRQRPLTNTKQVEISPAWSPDGERLAYLTASGIWLSDIRGKKRKRLLKKKLGLENNIAFTPDGRYIARLYTKRQGKPTDGSDPQFNYLGESGVEMINIRGGRVRRFPFYRGNHHSAWKPRHVAISPDGNMIAFDWFRLGLHTATVKGRDLKRITPSSEETIEYVSPIFSADGKSIFAGYTEESGNRLSGFYKVTIGDNKSGQNRPGEFPLTLSLAPGGERIIYDVLNPGTELTDTWVAGLDGRDARKLAPNAAMPAAQP